jgi:hypothetical protein
MWSYIQRTQNVDGARLFHIATRVKDNGGDPTAKIGHRGAPTKYGRKFKRCALLEDEKDFCPETISGIDGQQKMPSDLGAHLFRRPIEKKVRLAVLSDGKDRFILTRCLGSGDDETLIIQPCRWRVEIAPKQRPIVTPVHVGSGCRGPVCGPRFNTKLHFMRRIKS